jgi:hypothetical protein
VARHGPGALAAGPATGYRCPQLRGAAQSLGGLGHFTISGVVTLGRERLYGLALELPGQGAAQDVTLRGSIVRCGAAPTN